MRLIQWRCTPALSPGERETLSSAARRSLISDSSQRRQTCFPLLRNWFCIALFFNQFETQSGGVSTQVIESPFAIPLLFFLLS